MNFNKYKRKKSKLSAKELVIIFAIAAAVILANRCLFPKDELQTAYGIGENELAVSFIDVGQGDSALISTPDGHHMLIDAGYAEYGETVCDYLASFGVDKLDYAVFTHPHEDHIGGAAEVISRFEVDNFIIPDCEHTVYSYYNMLDAIDKSGADVIFAEAGYEFTMGDAEIKILSPIYDEYEGLNEYSVVLHITYGDTSFLFTGDAEVNNEYDMIENFGKKALSADVLKVGHHGSSTSSCDAFLNAVSPSVAVVSCGYANDYGHPHDEIVEALMIRNITLLQTFEDGNIVIASDGESIRQVVLN